MMQYSHRQVLATFLVAVSLAGLTGFGNGVFKVKPIAETDPVRGSMDAADDPAVWIHPSDPAQSLIIGTDKRAGLAIYDLSGKELAFYRDGKMNNVDVQYQFPSAGEQIDIVVASDLADDSLAIYRVGEDGRSLVPYAARTIRSPFTTQGLCLYRSPKSGEYYAIVVGLRGEVEQYRLFAGAEGKVDAEKVREFHVGSKAEGCAADQELGHLYIGEESRGVWKYGAEPETGTERTLVEGVEKGHLRPDVEGISIYYAQNGKGYLLVSSQGNDTFAVYEREGDNRFVMNFQVAAGKTVDGVTHTDGLDVISTNLGPLFPEGVFIAQDDANTNPKPGRQNFKLVPWQEIARAPGAPLLMDSTWNPRR